MKDLDYYIKALTMADLAVTEAGAVVFGEEDKAVKVNKRDLVLPTRKVLEASDWENVIPFHPLCEANINNKRSLVLEKFILLSNFNLDHTVRKLMSIIATKLSDNVTLPPDALETISEICQEATKFTADDVNKIFIKPLSAGPPKAADRALTVSLKRNDTHDGKKYRAVAKLVSLPYNADDKEGEFFGIKCSSKQSSRAIKGLFNYIVDGVESLEVFTTATNTTVASQWTAYTKTLGKIHEHLNQIKTLFELTDEFNEVDTGFLTMTKEMSKLKSNLPSLEDNRGEYVDEEVGEVKAPEADKTVPLHKQRDGKAKREPTLLEMNAQGAARGTSIFAEPEASNEPVSLLARNAQVAESNRFGTDRNRHQGRPGVTRNTSILSGGGRGSRLSSRRHNGGLL